MISHSLSSFDQYNPQDISNSTSRFDQLSRRMWIHKYRSLGHKSRVEQCSPVLLLGKRHRNWLLELLLKITRTTKPTSKQIFLRMSIWKLWGIGNLLTKKIHHNATFHNWFVTIILILSTLIPCNQTLPSQLILNWHFVHTFICGVWLNHSLCWRLVYTSGALLITSLVSRGTQPLLTRTTNSEFLNYHC